MKKYEKIKRHGKLLVERKLVWGSSGNISIRVGPNNFLISAAGSDIGMLRDEDLILCAIDEEKWEGKNPPSIERGLHKGIYQTCGEKVEAVIHAQPFYSSLVSSSDVVVRTDVLPESMAYLGAIERVQYHHAGSLELAEATAAKSRLSRVLLLENHGVVCWGSSLEEALLKTETLEFLCRMLIVSLASGICLNYLGENIASDFLKRLHSLGKQV